MSEYQYYEFLAIDRPLDKAAQATMRALSSRARVTATSFTVTYNYGDFRGDPGSLMEEWFDLHLYLANWNSRRLMIRLPERLIDRRVVDACLIEPEFATFRVAGEHLILDINIGELEADWADGTEWLAALAPLRADLLAGDQRLLYLVWLMAVEFDIAREDAPEPLPGIGPLTGSLEAFATFFCLDPDLVEAAAERGRQSIAPNAARDAILALSDGEKSGLLTRLFEGDPHVGPELRASIMAHLDAGGETARRTAGELKARAAEIKLAREHEAVRKEAAEREQLARDEEEKRQARLLAIARRGEGVWRDVEAEIERSNAAGYNRAVELLLDLRAMAEGRDAVADFAHRVVDIRERHARKARFIQRIVEIG